MNQSSTATIQAEPPDRMVTPPSQLALDNLTETLAALLDEARSLFGADAHDGFAQILLSRVDPAVWHALPQEPQVGRGNFVIWKYVAEHGQAKLTVFCAHDGTCPDIPPTKAES